MAMNIGVYKVLSVFGERGFGVVCLAECERPVKRRVTLKVIKPGRRSAIFRGVSHPTQIVRD
jgi:hypothetical protein